MCLEGPVFRGMEESELIPMLPRLRILARSSPLDKLKLVQLLQKQGEVVAVTGDGVNDGPALKKADVGFAMGLSGTEAAKEASAIVLLDDNFASIVNAIKWGRNVFDAIRKFLQFQLTVNFAAIVVVLIVVLADPDGNAENSPLKPVQLLWINLIMDSFAALALATEPPTEKLLTYKPYDRNEPLLTTFMLRRMAVQVVMMSVTFLTILYAGEDWFDSHFHDSSSAGGGGATTTPMPGTTGTFGNTTTTAVPSSGSGHEAQFSTQHYTIFFNSFVLSQLVNQINSRKLHGELNVFSGLQRHFIFCGVWVFSLVIQVLITEFGGTAIETEALTGEQWAGCIVIALLPLVWSTIFSLLPSAVTTDPWPWFKSPCSSADDDGGDGAAPHIDGTTEAAELLPVDRHRKHSGGASTFTSADGASLMPTPRGREDDIVITNATESSSSLRDHLGRRISESMGQGSAQHPRHMWDVAVWQVLTQLDVVDTMRRHHR